MTEDQQQAVIRFLASPSTHGGVPVERIETHASLVFLAGDRAWKMKRAVKYDYLDFSTAARRRAMCEAEVRLNRRTAPSIYRGVVAVTRETDDGLALTPRLPRAWPELKITRVHLHDQVLNITAKGQTVQFESSQGSSEPLVVELPKGWTMTNASPETLSIRTN